MESLTIKRPPVDVTKEDPYAQDTLSRRESIQNLVQIISSLPCPFVLSLNSPYGTGKTTYVKQLQAECEREGRKCLYFDAWATDFVADPFIALMGEFKECFPDSTESNVFKKAAKIGGDLVKASLPILLKILTKGILDLKKLESLGVEELSENITQSLIDGYKKEKDALADFKMELKAFVTKVSANGPLIIFVDELDRCRPTYAIEVLERIKHLFNVPNIMFVLSMHQTQLEKSIARIYGEIDGDGYIRKFIDLQISLPEPSIIQFIDGLFTAHNLGNFFDGREIYPQIQNDGVNFKSSFAFLCRVFKLPLRAIEQCFVQFAIVLKMTGENQYLDPEVVALMLVLKASNRSLYLSCVNGSSDIEKIILEIEKNCPPKDPFRFDELFPSLNNISYVIFELMIRAAEEPTQETLWDKYYQSEYTDLNNKDPDNELDLQSEKRFGQLNYIQQSARQVRRGTLRGVLNKIELLSPFKFENSAS